MDENTSHDMLGQELSRQDASPAMTGSDSHDVKNFSAVNKANYTMTIAEAHREFGAVGLPISERTASRYCEKGKMDCLKIDPDTGEITTGKHFNYVINPGSLQKQFERMREKRELENRRVDMTRQILSPPSSRHDASEHVEAKQDTSESVQNLNEDFFRMTAPDTPYAVSKPAEITAPAEPDVELSKSLDERDKKIKDLEKELINMEIEKRVAYKVRDEIMEQSKALVDKISDSQYNLGAAESQLKSLMAPKEHESENHSDRQE